LIKQYELSNRYLASLSIITKKEQLKKFSRINVIQFMYKNCLLILEIPGVDGRLFRRPCIREIVSCSLFKHKTLVSHRKKGKERTVIQQAQKYF
jgi:hypothetical protein